MSKLSPMLLAQSLFGESNNFELKATPKTLNWYKSLDIHQRISLREITPLLVGVNFQFLTQLFSIQQTIEILYQKLETEGFDMNVKS